MGCGVRPGDNLAPTLFILVMHGVSQVLLDELKKNNIDSPFFMHNSNNTGPIRLHKLNTSNSHMYSPPLLLYVDDGAFVFTNRSDASDGSQIAVNIMDQSGLTIHVGQNETKPKSEAVFFQPDQQFADGDVKCAIL